MKGSKQLSAVILARQGSKTLVNKNLRTICGRTLLEIAIENALKSDIFDNVYVSTDGHNIAAEAERCGAIVHYRDPETASDNASSLHALQEFLSKHPSLDNIVLIQCTSPFLKPVYLKEAYEKMKNQELDCIFSVTRSWKLRWSPQCEALNFSTSSRPRRQDWSGELVESGMFYFTNRTLLEQGVIQGGECGLYEIPSEDALDIDTYEDVILAECITKKRQAQAVIAGDC